MGIFFLFWDCIVVVYLNFFFFDQAIHAEAPEFSEMSVEQEILVTGIKVVDLLAPYAKGGKIGKRETGWSIYNWS